MRPSEVFLVVSLHQTSQLRQLDTVAAFCNIDLSLAHIFDAFECRILKVALSKVYMVVCLLLNVHFNVRIMNDMVRFKVHFKGLSL